VLGNNVHQLSHQSGEKVTEKLRSLKAEGRTRKKRAEGLVEKMRFLRGVKNQQTSKTHSQNTFPVYSRLIGDSIAWHGMARR